VLVNNAGAGVTARLIDTPLADYDRVMNVNVRGYLLYAQQAYPHLARRRGFMIHVASDAGIWGEQDQGESGEWPVPPIGRVGQASDVAAAAVFYASGEAGFVTGNTLLIDGGMTAGYLQRERNAP
jgi:NAD(P)-dependent dehydrogenase (short-subunit alcohol dehydrogenase family)